MNTLITITDDEPTPEMLREALKPFTHFYYGEDAYAKSIPVDDEFDARYENYLARHAAHNAAACWWTSLWLSSPKNYERWLVGEGVRIFLPHELHDFLNLQTADRVRRYACLDADGAITGIFERSKPDILGEGGLISGERLDIPVTPCLFLFDDGSAHAGNARRRADIEVRVLLSDDADAAIDTWQFWERRYEAHWYTLRNGRSFTEWRNDFADGVIERLSGDEATFYLKQAADIAVKCRSRQEYVDAATIAPCDAIIINNVWHEKKGNDWGEIVRWSSFVNNAILTASHEQWIAAFKY
jgi:hypothetical protein